MGLFKSANISRNAVQQQKITEPAQSWRYAGGKRDLRLDAMRGFAVFVMVVDHLGGDSSWLYKITGGGRFFISAAEPFIFISGLVMGIVYAGVIARLGMKEAATKALKRAGMLYLMNSVLTLTLAFASLQLNLNWAPHWESNGLLGFVFDVLTLHRAYYLTDVLLLYTFLVTAAIPILALLSRKKAWLTALVLVASWALWLAWQFAPQRVDFPWTISDNGMFHFSAWQVLFVNALVIGFYRPAIEARFHNIRRPPLYAILGLSGVLVACSIALYVWSERSAGGNYEVILAQLFAKADMRIGRLAVFAAFATFAFTLLTVAWKPVRRAVGWLILPLGQNALSAYTLHIVFAVIAASLLPRLLGPAQEWPSVSTSAQVLGLLLIWASLLIAAPLKNSGRRWTRSLTNKIKAAGALLPGGTMMRPGWSALPVLGLVIGLMLVAAPPVIMVSAAVRGPVRQTIGNLDEKGRTTIVMVPTITSAFPLATAPVSPAEPQEAAAPVPTVTRQPIEFAGTPLSMALAPAATSTPTAQTTPLPAGAQSRSFYSASLGRTMSYIVYLPPGYSTNPNVRYPVLYMLHGIGSGNTEWVRYGLLGWGDQLMRANMINQFIIVLPQGEESYWVDWANGGPKWGAYLAKDVVGEIDAHFRTLAQRDQRAIGGISMGGHAALQLSINYPTVFGIAGAHSPSLHTRSTAPQYFGNEAYFEAHDPSHLFTAHPEIARTLKLWIDVGEKDAWLPVVSALHTQLQTEDIAHEWHTFTGDTLTGGHTGEYWSTHIPDYLRFYSSAFKAR